MTSDAVRIGDPRKKSMDGISSLTVSKVTDKLPLELQFHQHPRSDLYLRPQKGKLKSPIITPDPKAKPAISRQYYSTLIPRGIHGGRERPDKPITCPSRKNKPENIPGQEEDLENKFL